MTRRTESAPIGDHLWLFSRALIACVLLVAAGLKVADWTHSQLPAPVQFGIVCLESLLAASLLTRPKGTSLLGAAVCVFSVFVGYNIYSIWKGASSTCSCWGGVDVPLTSTLVLDLTCLVTAALNIDLRTPPAGVAPGPVPIDGAKAALCAFVIFMAMSIFLHQPDPRIARERPGPTTWIESEIAEIRSRGLGLDMGDWDIIYFRNSCIRCQETVPVLLIQAQNGIGTAKRVFVNCSEPNEEPRILDGQFPGDSAYFLSKPDKWIETPQIIRIRGGIHLP